METETNVEISVKTERIDPEIDEKTNEIQHVNGLLGDFKLREEEVWIKPDIEDSSQDSVKNGPPPDYIEVEVKEEFPPSKDDSVSKLPLKKRIQSLDKVQKDLSGDDDSTAQNEKGQEGAEADGENTGQTDKVDDDKPKEKYIMYSYEVTKNIQIVTITEEERQIEHMENMKLRQHMRHVCEDCAIGFVLEQAYLMHMKVHSKEAGEHECELCHSHLKTADMLYRHRLRHYRRYRCLLCWTRFKDKDTAACHVMTDHVGTAFHCEHCGRGFKRPQYLKRHVEQYHTKPHRLECAVCFRVFHERGWYRSHIRTHNEEVRLGTVKVPVTCDVCSRTFKNKSCLKRHLQAHQAENVPCDLCHLVLKNRHALGQHYLNVHHEKYEGAPEVTCALCLRVCATRAMLKRHVRRMHSDRTKKYQCDHCQRYYLTKGEVRSHISWSHAAGARAGHACGCGRVFRTPSLLRDHAARFHAPHPPPRNHECELCGKAFSNKQVLTRHKKSHSNEMYPCNECGLLFKTQPYVKVHYQIKHLNMTRAQIKAQRKLNKQNRIAQNNIHVKPNWEPVIPNKKHDVSENDPLLVQKTDIAIKLEKESDEGEEEINVPLFQTFIDVDRN
ncbi:unnamed protein product [Arctia plantaginis]|uniref:C2H2-type domain-containing protein n=1 Tax=Arctia plantaginis TaxID=874455 RepID=A0A8S1A4Z5_ARCPL|nr:unnamed protein product [Arctia plantaginis]CAB3241408.1 unnamed protein product [Arctia plantaginis]